MTPDDDLIAELSRLRAIVLRMTPVVNAALELRRMGRAIDEYDSERDQAVAAGIRSARCMSVSLMMENAYATALAEFDKAVVAAALDTFAEFQAATAASQAPGGDGGTRSGPECIKKEHDNEG